MWCWSSSLGSMRIGDAGAAVLAAALQAMPRIRFTELDLAANDLTAAGVASLAPALRRPRGAGGLRGLSLTENPSLGDTGVAALAKALPPALETLDLSSTGCGDDGFVALAAALPTLANLSRLHCCCNSAATARGWVALAHALPSLPALRSLWLSGSMGVASEAAAALAAVIPNCPRLNEIHAGNCSLAEGDRSKLEALVHLI